MGGDISLKEAAAELGCSYDTAAADLSRGEFPNAYRRGERGAWRIPRTDVEAFRERLRVQRESSRKLPKSRRIFAS